MAIKKFVALGVICIAVTGCAQMRQAQRDAHIAEKRDRCSVARTAMQAESKAAYDAFYAGKSIAAKVPRGSGPVAFELTQNKAYASDQEAKELHDLAELRRSIRLKEAGWWADCAPTQVSAAYLEANKRTDATILDMSQKRITLGEGVTRVRAISSEYEEQLPTLLREAQAQYNQAVANEEAAIAERQRDAFRATAASRPIVAPLPQVRSPIQTNCSSFDNMTNCTTY